MAYTIQHGDTLWSIAQRFLGNGNLWHQLQVGGGWNGDPRSLQPGMVITSTNAAPNSPLYSPPPASPMAPMGPTPAAQAPAPTQAQPAAPQPQPAPAANPPATMQPPPALSTSPVDPNGYPIQQSTGGPTDQFGNFAGAPPAAPPVAPTGFNQAAPQPVATPAPTQAAAAPPPDLTATATAAPLGAPAPTAAAAGATTPNPFDVQSIFTTPLGAGSATTSTLPDLNNPANLPPSLLPTASPQGQAPHPYSLQAYNELMPSEKAAASSYYSDIKGVNPDDMLQQMKNEAPTQNLGAPTRFS